MFSFVGFREVGDILVRIVDERRVIIRGSVLVELVGPHNLWSAWNRPGSHIPRPRAEGA